MIYLYITPFFPSPTNWRGAYCYDFVVALQKRGVDVRVFVPGSGGDYTVGGVHVYTFPVKELPSAIFPFFYRRRNERSFLKKVQGVVDFDSRLRLVVHAHTARFAIYALAVKKANPNCTTLLHHHDPQSFGLNLGILRHSFLYNAWLFRKFRKVFEEIDLHVFISEAVKRSFLSAPDASWTDYAVYRRQMRGPGFFRCRPVRVKDSIVLHNGVDTNVFHSVNPVEIHEPRTTSHEPRSLAIGCIGNFVDWKDQATLIRAMEVLKSKSKSRVESRGRRAVACYSHSRRLHRQRTSVGRLQTSGRLCLHPSPYPYTYNHPHPYTYNSLLRLLPRSPSRTACRLLSLARSFRATIHIRGLRLRVHRGVGVRRAVYHVRGAGNG